MILIKFLKVLPAVANGVFGEVRERAAGDEVGDKSSLQHQKVLTRLNIYKLQKQS